LREITVTTSVALNLRTDPCTGTIHLPRDPGYDALSSWSNSSPYLNFTEQTVDISTAFGAEAWARLRALRAAVDPTGILRANHTIR
jgi:FAD/FMN-containing dehydrogenase